jgi:hypothetical protein
MRICKVQIAVGLGDNLTAKAYLDTIKKNFDQIFIAHNKEIVAIYRGNNPECYKFLDDLGRLLFSETPYIFTPSEHYKNEEYKNYNSVQLVSRLGVMPQKPELKNLLCKGNSLNLNEEYIVLTTKIRDMNRENYCSISSKLWESLRQLSQKYKIVILGERMVEINAEYAVQSNSIYGIYNDIMENIPKNRIIDLSIPALGLTAPNLVQLQQDCLIMNEAKFVLTLGLGGNFAMAISVANVVGYRTDYEDNAEMIFAAKYPPLDYNLNQWEQNNKYPNVILTKSFDVLLSNLNKYL